MNGRTDGNLLNWINLFFGVTVGAFSSFFLIVVFLPGNFEKPWDTLWTSFSGIIGALIGSLIGGLIAYKISITQLELQNKKERNREKSIQERYAKRIISELRNNKEALSKIHSLLSDMKDEFPLVAKEISKGNSELTEGINLFANQIEIDLLLQLRNQVIDEEYLLLHRNIDDIYQVKNLCHNLSNQTTIEYINISLDRILKKASEVLISLEQLNITN